MSNFHMSGLALASLMLAAVVTQSPPVSAARPLTIVGAPQTGSQSRDQSQRRPLVGTGSLSGTVVNQRGQPIKGARVSLGGGSVGRSAITGASGEFTFEKLPEGRYGINANRTRYLSGSYGQTRPERSGTTIQLEDGEAKKDLTITLFAAAVITGTVCGDDGEPVQSAQVRALRYSMRTGVRRLQSSSNASTDDRGVYRLYGLSPGEYVISATSNNQDNGPLMTAEMAIAMERAAAAAAAAGDNNVRMTSLSNGAMTLSNGAVIEADAPVAFAPTYYPGSTSPAGAMSVTVQSGEERQGIDVTLMKVQTATVTGMVVSATGVPPQNVSVTLQPADEAAQGIPLSSSRSTADGRFTLRNVPPGQYNVVARATSTVRVELPMSATAGGSRVQTISTSQTTSTGRTLISVDGASLTGVVVTLDGGRSVSGRVVFDGGMPPDLSRTRMTASLQMAPGSSSMGVPMPSPAAVAADGSFTIGNVAPGRYALRVSGVQGFSMKSSLVHGRESLDFPFEVDDSDIGDGQVTVSAGLGPTQVGGTITEQLGHPAVDYTIVIFSADTRYWTPGSRRISTTRPGTDGKYSVRGLPAGEYQIAALGDLEPGTQYDPEFLKALLVASTRVTVGEGGKATQDLRITVARTPASTAGPRSHTPSPR
jgi:sarcosine oxidase gamma subunit